MTRLLAAALAALLATTACAASDSRTAPPRRVPMRHSVPQGPAARPKFVFLLTDDLDAGEISVMPRLKSLLTDQGTTLSN